MLISSDAYELLLEGCPPAPPESGGILGGKNGVVSLIEHDLGRFPPNQGTYSPDVNRLNRQIGLWQSEGISFYGIFHTHPLWDKGLSGGDRAYIRRILISMPVGFDELLFPVVYPRRCILSYSARRTGNDVIVTEDSVQIIRQG